MAITWRKNYEVGIEKVDEQHKELFQKINNLLEACTNHKGREEVVETINFLEEYVNKHFSEEEQLQRDYSYPEYVKHKAAHEQFTRNFLELKKKLQQEGPTLQFIMQVNKVVVDWLIIHITNVDKAFGNFVNEKK